MSIRAQQTRVCARQYQDLFTFWLWFWIYVFVGSVISSNLNISIFYRKYPIQTAVWDCRQHGGLETNCLCSQERKLQWQVGFLLLLLSILNVAGHKMSYFQQIIASWWFNVSNHSLGLHMAFHTFMLLIIDQLHSLFSSHTCEVLQSWQNLWLFSYRLDFHCL